MVPNILMGTNDTKGKARPSVLLPPAAGAEGPLFDGALLDNTVHKRKKADWVISFAVHAALVAALVIVPLFFTQAFDLTRSEITYLAPPPTPYAPPPPPAAAASVKPATTRVPKIRPSTLTMPIAIPRKVEVLHDAPSLDADLSAAAAGVPGGVIGGVPGGVVGGVLGSIGTVPPPPPPAPAVVASNGPLHVGGEVKSPRAIYTPQPKYPLLALQARIEGDVQIDAVIDKNGDVVQEKVMDGPPLLVSAAMDAVKHWKYQPTVLNGTPWPVELTINVTFSLS